MFQDLSYLGYTLIFTIPPIIFLWLRRDFFDILKQNLKTLLISTALLTVYGSIMWKIGLHFEAWTYSPEKLTGLEFLTISVEDIVWWTLVSFLFSSFAIISTYYEDRNVNIVMRELNGLMKSFMYASSGFRALTTERNTVIHIAVAVLVIISAAFFQITRAEWMFLILAISLVVSLELMNNAIERLCSKYTTKYNEDIKFIKDAAAAAVLISSVAAFVTGMVIFMPRIIDIVSR